MRFYDEAKIELFGGHGGAGCISFRREKFIPRGGPDGGEGGAGGSIIFVSNPQMTTLQDFRYRRIYKADRGDHGSGNNRAGREAEDLIIQVPTGTLVRDATTRDIMKDLSEPGERWVICQGGRGGKGNSHFVSSTFQAPKFSQPGEPGEEKLIVLELRLLADIGLIGFPNAGKSSLISRVSNARPKIADYPFTTLEPALGVVDLGDGESTVMVDIPGLIEGASEGHGLGLKFLRHVERTKMLTHLIDGATLLEAMEESENPAQTAAETFVKFYSAIRKELGQYSETLIHKPETILINKSDLFQPSVRAAILEEISKIAGWAKPVTWISAVSGEGVPTWLMHIRADLIRNRREIDEDGQPIRIKMPDEVQISTP